MYIKSKFHPIISESHHKMAAQQLSTYFVATFNLKVAVLLFITSTKQEMFSCVFVCLSVIQKKLCINVHEIFGRERPREKEHPISFRE